MNIFLPFHAGNYTLTFTAGVNGGNSQPAVVLTDLIRQSGMLGATYPTQ